jgi:hypothetical protein
MDLLGIRHKLALEHHQRLLDFLTKVGSLLVENSAFDFALIWLEVVGVDYGGWLLEWKVESDLF